MNKFNDAPDQNKKENPQIKGLFDSFAHYIGHFILKSRMFEDYNAGLLNKTKESLIELLKICKNEKMRLVLGTIKDIIDKIDINSKLDNSIFEDLNKLLDELGSEQKY